MNKVLTGKRIYTTVRKLDRLANIDLKKLGIGNGQIFTLEQVIENPGIHQEKISEILAVDKTTTAKAVKKLINNEFIIKTGSEDDKRIYNLYPTDKALNIYPELKKLIDYSASILFKDFSEEEISLFDSLLKKAGENTDKEMNIRQGLL